MPPLTESLKNLGLGDYEAMIYGVLLAHSPTSATFIAKKCELSRSSVYTTLHALTGKGLVKTTQKNGVKQFMVTDVAALDQMLETEARALEKKRGLFKAIEGTLKQLRDVSLDVPRVSFFEGQAGLKQAYIAMMRQARPGSILYLARDEFVWRPEWSFIFAPDWHDRMKRFKLEKRLKTRLLVNASSTETKHRAVYHQKKGLDVRFLKLNPPLRDFGLYILGDIVNLLSFEQGNLLGVTIVNQSVARNLVSLFEGWWKGAAR